MATYDQNFESGETLTTLGFTNISNCENTSGEGRSSVYGVQSTGTASQQYYSEFKRAIGGGLNGSVQWDTDLSAAAYSEYGSYLGQAALSGFWGGMAWAINGGVGASHRDFELYLSGEYGAPAATAINAHPGIGIWATIKVDWTSSTFEVPSEDNGWDGVINADGAITVSVNGTPVITLTNVTVFTNWGEDDFPYFTYPDAGLWNQMTFGPMGRLDNIDAESTGGGGAVPDAPVITMTTPAYSRNLIITWPEVVGATSFSVERCQGAACSGFVEIDTVTPPAPPTTPSFTDSGLTADTLYRYRVKAVNGYGSSAYSNIVDGTTLAGEIGVIRIGGAAGQITDWHRIDAVNSVSPIWFGYASGESESGGVNRTDPYAVSVEVFPVDSYPHLDYIYEFRLRYWNGSAQVYTDYSDPIVYTSGLIPHPIPPLGSGPYTLELAFEYGSEDVLTHTRVADGWIECKFNGVTIFRIEDLIINPNPSYNWNTVVINQNGYASALYVRSEAVFESYSSFNGWSAVPSSHSSNLWAGNYADMSNGDIWYDSGSSPTAYWKRRQGMEEYQPKIQLGADGNNYVYSNINYMWHWENEFAPSTPGTLTVNKVCASHPDQVFDFTTYALYPTTFDLKHGESQVYTNLTPGVGYQINETPVAGFTTTYTVSNGSPHDNISVASGENVVVTVDNVPTALATITVIKVCTVSPELDFTINAGSPLSPASFTLKDGESQVYNNVSPGTGYSIVETVPTGWSVAYSVSNGGANTNFSVSAGENVTVIITNTLAPVALAVGGIYKIVPGKREDTLWITLEPESTVDVKIPDPYIRTGLIGE